MKLGIISSWYEMLPLMQFLNKTEHEVHFFVDRAMRPWWEKSPALREKRLEQSIELMQDSVDALIVPPSLEARFIAKNTKVLPLFETYLHDFAFTHSLVGKIWLLCEQSDSDNAQQILTNYASSYTPSVTQQETKKFLTPFARWQKTVRMWTYFLTTYWRSEPMLRKTLKHDLQYFSDAWVDTLIPLSRWFLFYQKIIKSRVNRKKTRFHGLDAVEVCFEKIIKERWLKESRYTITLHHTDLPTPLLQEKKWMQVLTKGGEVELELQEVEI